MTATASEASVSASVEPRAVSDRAGIVVVARRFAIVLLLVLLDLWTKAMVFGWLGDVETADSACHEWHRDHRVPLIGDWFAFMRSTNRGAAFGKLSEWPHLLIFGRALAAVFLSYLLLRNPTSRKLFTTAMILILAGALGNLYDNLWLDPPAIDEGGTGYAAGVLGNLYNVLVVGDLPSGHPYGEVRDFIDVYFPIWDWHFPTFNVADSCITVGAVLLLVSGFFTDETKPDEQKAEPQ